MYVYNHKIMVQNTNDISGLKSGHTCPELRSHRYSLELGVELDPLIVQLMIENQCPETRLEKENWR